MPLTVNKVILGEGLNIPAEIDTGHLKKKIKEWYEEQLTAPTGPIKYTTKKGEKYKVSTTYQNQQVSINQITSA